MLSRDTILKSDDLKRERVDVPEWAVGTDPAESYVYVRMLTGTERDSFEQSCLDGAGQPLPFVERTANIRARLAAYSMSDAEGNRLFTDADATELGKKSASALDRVYHAALRLNKIGRTDIEELAKNSETGPGAGST